MSLLPLCWGLMVGLSVGPQYHSFLNRTTIRWLDRRYKSYLDSVGYPIITIRAEDCPAAFAVGQYSSHEMKRLIHKLRNYPASNRFFLLIVFCLVLVGVGLVSLLRVNRTEMALLVSGSEGAKISTLLTSLGFPGPHCKAVQIVDKLEIRKVAGTPGNVISLHPAPDIVSDCPRETGYMFE